MPTRTDAPPMKAVADIALATLRALGIEATLDRVPAGGPPAGSIAVTGDLRGELTGTVALVLSGDVAGPLGDLTVVVEGGLTEAVAAASGALGGRTEVRALRSVEAGVAHGEPGTGAAVVGLAAGGSNIGTFSLRIDPPPSVPAQGGPAAEEPAGTPQPAKFDQLPTGLPRGTANTARLELLADVQMAVTVELGRTRMTVRDLLSLAPGAVVELDRAAGSPVDLYVNGRLMAHGEVVVVDEEFGVRITDIVGDTPIG